MNVSKRVILNRSRSGTPSEPAFVIRVKTDNAGTSASNQFRLPLGAQTCDVTTSEQTLLAQTGTVLLSWAVAGSYDIYITGLTTIETSSGGDPLKLIEVKNWGTSSWNSFVRAFNNCSNLTLISAPDKIISTGGVSCFSIFRKTALTTFDFAMLNGMLITLFSNSFDSITTLLTVSNLNLVNGSSLTEIPSMFAGCTSLNSNVGGLDISNVTVATTFMTGVTLSTANYDATLIAFEAQSPNALNISFGSSKYTNSGAALAARTSLIGTYGWVITDGGAA